MNRIIIITTLINVLFSLKVNAQLGYAKDSLQIKVYTEILYDNFQPKSIKVTKAFCDYCDENQLRALKQEAWYRSYAERYLPKHRAENGIRKLALYIRIAKKDFLAIREVEIDSTKTDTIN